MTPRLKFSVRCNFTFCNKNMVTGRCSCWFSSQDVERVVSSAVVLECAASVMKACCFSLHQIVPSPSALKIVLCSSSATRILQDAS